MVISTHPQQRHLLNVRWNNRMRQHSTIDMTDVASAKEPQRDASPGVAISCTGSKQASTSELAARSSSPGPIRGTAAPACGLATLVRPDDRPGHGERTALGVYLPTALLSSVPGSPSGGPVAACSRTDGRGHLAELGAHDPNDEPLNATRDCYAAAVDAHSSGGATDALDSGETVPASANAPRADTHASPTCACPEEGDEVQVHGQSASAMVIPMHPEQCDQVCVRWNTRMREYSTIDLADIASLKPRQSKRTRVSSTTAETCLTAHLTKRHSGQMVPSLGPGCAPATRAELGCRELPSPFGPHRRRVEPTLPPAPRATAAPISCKRPLGSDGPCRRESQLLQMVPSEDPTRLPSESHSSDKDEPRDCAAASSTCGPQAWLTGSLHDGGIRSVRSPLRRAPLLATPIAMPLQCGRP